jgi:hypothetical protein
MMPGAAWKRMILATTDMVNQLTGPFASIAETVLMMKVRADLDIFSTGQLIVVASGKVNKGYMKHLTPPEDGIWEIRCRDPKPGIRVFGMFAQVDVLVVTNCKDRITLREEGSREWRDELLRCKAEWRKLFHPHQPQCGLNINDYISDSVVDNRYFN